MTADQQTLRDLVSSAARRFDSRAFLECEDGKLSFADLDEKTDRAATGLNRLGLRPGERVALLFSNRLELAVFLLGVPKFGMVSVPIDPLLSHREILFAIRHSGAGVVVTESRFLGLCRRADGIRHCIAVDDPTFSDAPFRDLERGSILGFWPDLKPDDTAVIAYTRCLAPAPRAVVLSHRNLVSNALQLLHPFRINETDRFLCALPLGSVTAQVLMLLAPLASGGRCILREASSPRILRDLNETEATVLAGVPPLYQRMAVSHEFTRQDFSSLRLAVCSSGPVGEKILEQFEEQHDALLVEGYGVPEATCLTCANPYTGVRKPGSLGIPLPGQVCRIVDGNGDELPAGEVGEILIRGPNVMKGYLDDPEASSQVLREGWLHTGDFGLIDSDGYYHLALTGE